MIDSTRAGNVWSSVALDAVRVMMAVPMYMFGTLFVLRLFDVCWIHECCVRLRLGIPMMRG